MQAKWISVISQFTKNNSTTILSTAAAAGVISTAILAVRNHDKAMKHLEKLDKANMELPEKKRNADLVLPRQRAKVVWRFYIPAGLSGTATIACIVGANAIGLRRIAALDAAYLLVNTTFREYKDKVLEEIGKNREEKIHDKMMAERIENNPPKEGQVIITGGGETVCYETLSGRYFRSDIEKIRRAENDFNAQILAGDMYLDLNEFYRRIGLGTTVLGDEMGWNVENMLELRFTPHLREEDGTPCLAIAYARFPIKGFGKF